MVPLTVPTGRHLPSALAVKDTHVDRLPLRRKPAADGNNFCTKTLSTLRCRALSFRPQRYCDQRFVESERAHHLPGQQHFVFHNSRDQLLRAKALNFSAVILNLPIGGSGLIRDISRSENIYA